MPHTRTMAAPQRVTPDALASRLRAAYTAGPVAPLRDGLRATDAQGAYAVQAINTAFWIAQGRHVVGRKIGLTAESVQAQLGVDQPDYGVLFTDMEVPDGGSLPMSACLQPKAEAEIAIVLKHDLADPQADAATIAAAIEYCVAAIEIVDSRIAAWQITLADTVADNGSSAFFVLGAERRAPQGLDLFSCGMVLEKNGVVQSLGAGAACLGHPLNAATWLARTAAAQGAPLKAGDLILTGALGPMVGIASGDSIRVTIGGLGQVSFCAKD